MAENEKELEIVEEESDFADEIKPAVAPEAAPENEPEEPEEKVDMYASEEEAAPAETSAEESNEGYYDDEHLVNIEKNRQDFYKHYSKFNKIKWIITAFSVLTIVCGWLIPNAIDALKDISMIIAIACCGVGLVTLLVFNSIFKKKMGEHMNRYFREYYANTNAYVFPEGITDIQGSVDNKLDEAEFRECNLYKDVSKVGSRACYTFKKGEKVFKIADAAAQVIVGKAMGTAYVGKFLITSNNYEGSDILIYFKGNKRALPPTNLAGRKVFSDSKNIVIYGDKGTEKVITEKVREALGKFHTNKTFVDMAIAIRAGKTFYAMGYEDDLMVINLEKPFDPNPTKQFKGDLAKLFDLAELLK